MSHSVNLSALFYATPTTIEENYKYATGKIIISRNSAQRKEFAGAIKTYNKSATSSWNFEDCNAKWKGRWVELKHSAKFYWRRQPVYAINEKFLTESGYGF